MNTKYIDLIDQTFDFPQKEFTLNKQQQLQFHDLDLMELIETYGTPLKLTYCILDKIPSNCCKSLKLMTSLPFPFALWSIVTGAPKFSESRVISF